MDVLLLWMAIGLMMPIMVITTGNVEVSAFQAPDGVTKSALNLNFELHWQAPSDATNLTTYSVEYELKFNKSWLEIPGCIAIQITECNNMTSALIGIVGQQTVLHAVNVGFYTRISRWENGTGPVSLSQSIRFWPALFGVEIGAPDLISLEVSSNAIVVGIVAPETPFTNAATGRFIRMDEKKYMSRCIPAVFYNYTLYRLPNETSDWQVERAPPSVIARGKGLPHEYTTLEIESLNCTTRYALVVQARVGSKDYGINKTTKIFKTKELAPSQGPVLSPVYERDINCSRPNRRDVLIKWKSPPQDAWNGDKLLYEVRATRHTRDGEHVSIINTSSTSTTLHGLSRWDRYSIVVYANTSAGGTPSQQAGHLPETVVGMAYSKPQDLRPLPTNSSSQTQVVAWKPPSRYQQCIQGYHVTLQSDDGVIEETNVKETQVAFEEVDPGMYLVEVAAIVSTGFNHTSLGETSRIRFRAGLNPGSKRFVQIPVVSTSMIVVCVLVALCCFKTITYVKRDRFTELNDNKILKRASSQVSSDTRRQHSEKETYDILLQCESLGPPSFLSSSDIAANHNECPIGAKTGAIDKEIHKLINNDAGQVLGDYVDSNQSPMLPMSPANSIVNEDSIFKWPTISKHDNETNLRDSVLSSQSSFEDLQDLDVFPVKDVAEISSGYTSVSSSCPSSRQTSLDDDAQFPRTTASDATKTSPYVEKNSTGGSLDYTILATTDATKSS